MTIQVFVSYRRGDSPHAAGRLVDRLDEHFDLYLDVDRVRPGVDFTVAVREAVDQTDVLVAVIGLQWLTLTAENGGRRIDQPGDWVAEEIGTALGRGTPVIPVLIDGADMPSRPELPPTLAALADRQALRIGYESFAADSARLIQAIESTVSRPDPKIVNLWEDPDYPQARAAFLQGHWPAAMAGFRRVLVRHPRHRHVVDQFDQARRNQDLLDLDAAAKEADDVGRWQEAVDALTKMDELQPSDDVKERLAKAQLMLRINELQNDIRAFAKTGTWKAVLAADTELTRLAPEAGNPDDLASKARAELLEAELAASYTKGVKQLNEHDWTGAEATFRALLERRPSYRDADGLLALARRQGGLKDHEHPPEPPAKKPVRTDSGELGRVATPNREVRREDEEQARPHTEERAGKKVEEQSTAESNAWARPRRRRRWLVPALAILAAVFGTAGLLLWAPWVPAPPAVPRPVAPAGLTGDVSGAKIALRWNDAPSGTAAVAHWRVLRDGKALIEKVTSPQATVPNQGSHSYTVVAIGKDGQDSAESQSWQAPPVWQKLKTGFQEYSLAGVAAHHGELWVVGGQDANGKRDEVVVFNPQTNKWRNGPKLPQRISHAPLVSTGDKLYLFGGLTATKDGISVPVATVYSLDTKTGGTWIKENELPARRFGGAAAWDGKRLVFAGGAETFEPNTPRPAKAEIWELRSGRWKSIDAVLQPPRDRLAAATDGKGSIWFVGGQEHVPRKIYADVEVLSGNKVSDSAPIRTAVQGAAAVWTPDAGTCVFGGSTVPQTEPIQPAMLVAKVQCLEGTGPGWPDLPEVRYNAGAAVIGSTVYVVGSRSCSPCLGGAGKEPDIVLALRFG